MRRFSVLLQFPPFRTVEGLAEGRGARFPDDQIGLMPESMIFHPQHGQDLTTKQARIGREQAKEE